MIDTAPEKVLLKDLHQEALADIDATNYRLNLLCNRFEKDKDLMLKGGEEIVKAVQSLQQELKAFTEMRGEIGEVLSDRIDQLSKDIYHATSSGVEKALRHNVKIAADRLDRSVDRTTSKIRFFYNQDKKILIWKILGFTILPVVASVITSIVVIRLLLKIPLW